MPGIPHYLRLFRGEPPAGPHVLATRELLRPPSESTRRPLEPFSRGWFEELELKRYQRQGAWLPRWLEFTRHAGESLLMLGPGLGSDAVQYQRHGTDVTIVIGHDDEVGHLKENLNQRDIALPIVTANGPLPIAANRYDLAYWNALHSHAEIEQTLAELYRVLKPGGKLFALFPARVDIDRFQKWLLPLRRFYRDREPRPSTSQRRTARELKGLLHQFHQRTIAKRLLRKSEVPHIWRWIPLSITERIMGRVLAVRAFKPLAAVRENHVNPMNLRVG